MEKTRLMLTLRQMTEFPQIHPTLLEVLKSLVHRWPHFQLVVTSLARTREEDENLGASGIHSAGPPWRAIDLRTRSLQERQMDRLRIVEEAVNLEWIYDPQRPDLKVLLVSAHGTGPHAHVQVHNRTIRREALQRPDERMVA